MGTLPSAPLPTSPPPPWNPQPYQGPTSGPPQRRRGMRIVVIVVVVILIVGVLAFLLLPSSNVVVTGINFSSPDDACGLDGATDFGFNDTTDDSVSFTYQISGNNTTDGGTAACQINSVSTSTPGFSISGANVPLSIPANTSQLLSYSVNTPDSPYTGVLTIVLT